MSLFTKMGKAIGKITIIVVPFKIEIENKNLK